MDNYHSDCNFNSKYRFEKNINEKKVILNFFHFENANN